MFGLTTKAKLREAQGALRLERSNHIDTISAAGEQLGTVLNAVNALGRAAYILEQKIEDPHDDGTGNGARPPTGGDYNTLMELVRLCIAKTQEAVQL
jgi:hypothetical protein